MDVREAENCLRFFINNHLRSLSLSILLHISLYMMLFVLLYNYYYIIFFYVHTYILLVAQKRFILEHNRHYQFSIHN